MTTQKQIAAKIIEAEKLPLRVVRGLRTGCALADESGEIVWRGSKWQIVAEVRRRATAAITARAKAAAETLPDLPSY